MKAAVLTGIGSPLEITDVPIPHIGPDEVLVETATCGICRTDIHIQDGLAYVPSLPHIPGHEPAGVVAQVGRDVTRIRPGQRVVPHLFVRSEDCRYTRAGVDAQATHLKGIIGVTMPGGFAEYFKAPATNLIPLPDGVPFDVGGLTSCGVITAVHAFRKAGLRMGESAVVLGAGGIGLILIQLLRNAGVRVFAVDRTTERFDQALQAGAERVASIGNDTVAQQIQAFAGVAAGGVDCVFELVGRADTMKAAASFVRRCGRIIVVGEEPEFPAIDTIQIAQRELQIIGSRNGGLQDALDALDLMAAKVIRPLIAGTFPLERINDALALVRNGQAQGRVIVRIKC
jgi:D-arabinose 1-dehydrogenase-like Zn-dependent alcohol dehydrogenase